MPTPRIIKKYANRRLYDTELSRYITFFDVRDLVMQGVEFKIVDSNSNEDLTRATLLQIMLEEESGGEPLFTAEMLAQIIRFYGGSVQGLFTRYLEESLSLFEQQQQAVQEALRGDPMETMADMAKRNMDLWSDMQRSLFRTMGLDPEKDK
ncbi:MAG: polyhydroxyalkanoate synthesis repressor PhaR [Gammaproteobacteria bacterium]|nr:polyhydroxyalkanoate synthesis repressor PhaR [Gammaproteobacteria bacterium]